MAKTSTQVAIVGSGPAGLLLSQLLHLSGIDSIIVERSSQEHVEGRIRAGVLEWSSVETLRAAGVGERMDAEGLPHDGFNILFSGDLHRIDLKGHTGRSVMVYGQTEVTKDLIAARLATGAEIVFEAKDVQPRDVNTEKPVLSYRKDGQQHEISCDFIAGCDGYHGITRKTMPKSVVREFERVYPFGWLGVLSDVPPLADELIYTGHERGFALCSMRSRSRSRYYIQCPVHQKPEDWSDDAFWEEFTLRIGEDVAARLTRGPSIEKSIAPLRSFVCEPMRYHNLFLAGDAAHIVPPTGAKGLNLAIADVAILHRGFEAHYRRNDPSHLDNYSERALLRVWKVERFSWYMSMMLHQFPDYSPFEKRMQHAEFEYVKSSEAASRAIAENYVGLPLE